MHLKTIFGNGAMTMVTLLLAYPATAQPVPMQARNACIQRSAEEMVVATRDVTITGAGPVNAENGVRTLFLRNRTTGQTAECRVNTIDGTVLSVNLTGKNSQPSTSNFTPTEGSFLGRGKANGAVFGGGQQADASLNFNRNGFSLSLSVPPGTGVQMQYQGTIQRIRSTNPDNPNSFVIEGQMESFASSASNLRVVNASGACQIEVFDARITSVSCNTAIAGGSTRFLGMKQF